MADVTDSGSMVPLLDKLYGKVFHREESLRIVVLGSPGVGKTGLLLYDIILNV